MFNQHQQHLQIHFQIPQSLAQNKKKNPTKQKFIRNVHRYLIKQFRKFFYFFFFRSSSLRQNLPFNNKIHFMQKEIFLKPLFIPQSITSAHRLQKHRPVFLLYTPNSCKIYT